MSCCYSPTSAPRSPITGIDGLISSLDAYFATEVSENTIEEIVAHGSQHVDETMVSTLVNILNAYDCTGYEKYIHFDTDTRYTRNLIVKRTDKYALILLCWNADRPSPIHDHPTRGCWLRVLDGTVTETRYAFPAADEAKVRSDECKDAEEKVSGCEVPLVVTKVTTCTAPSPSCFMHDTIGLHSVSAVGGDAITLHLYVPEYTKCRVFDEKTGTAASCDAHYDTESSDFT